MKTKKFTQFGTISVIILLPLLLLFAVNLIQSGLNNEPYSYTNIFLFILFLLCVLTFYQLKIKVTQNSLSFKLGIGLFGKKYKISNIQSCRAVSNSIINGIGIRLISNGWLYNVSGLKAIELQFKNKGSVVRIGTNKPEEVCQLIQSLIDSDEIKHGIPEQEEKINPQQAN
jgi:hypothetical protein